MLSIPCPTENDFKSFDENNDGNLTLEEYFHHIDSYHIEQILRT